MYSSSHYCGSSSILAIHVAITNGKYLTDGHFGLCGSYLIRLLGMGMLISIQVSRCTWLGLRALPYTWTGGQLPCYFHYVPRGWKFFGPQMFRFPKKQCIFGKYTIWPLSPGVQYIQVLGHRVFNWAFTGITTSKILTLCPHVTLYSTPKLLEDNLRTKSMLSFSEPLHFSVTSLIMHFLKGASRLSESGCQHSIWHARWSHAINIIIQQSPLLEMAIVQKIIMHELAWSLIATVVGNCPPWLWK